MSSGERFASHMVCRKPGSHRLHSVRRYVVPADASMSRAYRLFRTMGLRHMFVGPPQQKACLCMRLTRVLKALPEAGPENRCSSLWRTAHLLRACERTSLDVVLAVVSARLHHRPSMTLTLSTGCWLGDAEGPVGAQRQAGAGTQGQPGPRLRVHRQPGSRRDPAFHPIRCVPPGICLCFNLCCHPSPTVGPSRPHSNAFNTSLLVTPLHSMASQTPPRSW